jgi:hypothetical protein
MQNTRRRADGLQHAVGLTKDKTVKDWQVEQAVDKQTNEADSGHSHPWGVQPNDVGPAHERPFGSPGHDDSETAARWEAKRQALFLMVASSVVMISLVAGVWLLLRRYL